NNELRGVSDSVPGRDYVLSIYLPENMVVSGARATVGGDREIEAHKEIQGNLLQVGFQGQSELVHWRVGFSTKSKS
ncbi:MAG TPA: hypothetical protein VE398_05515, partial [Acidobacteriota bacterium]|nr:hypothetical protein [Acidobacteriota bacterium]